MRLRRSSPWLAVLSTAMATPVLAQDSAVVLPVPAPAEAPALKRRNVAVALGLIPGGGHLYAGEQRRGALTLGAFTLGVLLLRGNSEAGGVCPAPPPGGVDPDLPGECESGDGWVSAGVAGLALSSLSWLYSVLDAGPAAARANRRNGLAAARVRAEPFVAMQRNGAARVGILAWAF